jgi:DNA-binding CsgD family transcriptional regulator
MSVVVVKLGSSLVADEPTGQVRRDVLERVCDEVVALHAAGDEPVIVDLETIMSHVRHPESGAAPRDVAEPFFFESIVRSVLVPRWIEAEGEGAVDVSALGAVVAQRSRVRAPVWAHVNTDAMELREEFRVGAPGANTPELDGAALSPNDFAAELRDGFTHAYELLAAHRDALLGDGGPVAEAARRVGLSTRTAERRLAHARELLGAMTNAQAVSTLYGGRPVANNGSLTPRQREVLRLIAEGQTTKAIARELGISVKTVETHRSLLMERLSIRDVAGLVRYALRLGLVSPDE